MHSVNPFWHKYAPEVFLVCFPPSTTSNEREESKFAKASGNTHCSPGASPPLVSSEHVGAARADAPGAITLVLERVLSEATVWGPLRAWWHGTVLVSFWDIIRVTLDLIDHVVTVVDTDHLPGGPPLPTRHGALHWTFRKRKGGSASRSGPKPWHLPVSFLPTSWSFSWRRLVGPVCKIHPDQPLPTISAITSIVQATAFPCQDYCSGLSAGLLFVILTPSSQPKPVIHIS